MIVGIDPDLHKSGVCVLNDDGSIAVLESMTIANLFNYVTFYRCNGFTYAIEDVNKIGAMYNSHKNKNPRIAANIAQKVGMVKGAATIIASFIEYTIGGSPIMAPVGLGKQVKKDAALFNQLSGWTGKSNEDMRDAWAIAKWVQLNKKGEQLNKKGEQL